MTDAIRVGTRRSLLARRQTELVLQELRSAEPSREFLAVPLATQGDRDRTSTVDLDFTDAIDRALEEGEVDLAVHSTKDLPARLVRPVEIVAFPPRADPRDALVLRFPGSLRSLPRGAIVGSSSLRRRAQILRSRPDLSVVDLRGNVDRRLARVRTGEIAGAVLAVAGLERLGRTEEIAERLDPSEFLPSPGQGALAVVARRGDREVRRIARGLDHARTRAEVTAERSLAAALGGDCTMPLGVLASVRGPRLRITAEVLSRDGRRSMRHSRTGPTRQAAALGRSVAQRLLASGARELLPAAPEE